MRRRVRGVSGVALAAVLVLAALAGTPGIGAVAGAPGGSAEFRVDGDRLTLQAGPGQTVRGTTDLPAGTTLTVRLRSSGASPFLLSTTTTVAEGGRFRAVVDLTNVQPGSAFTATVHHNGTVLAETRGEVVECTDACETPPPAEPTAALLPEEGNLSLSAGPGQAVRGRSNLQAGTRVRVVLGGGDGGLPPLASRAVVDAEGRFHAVADLGGLRAGRSVRVSVRHDGVELAARTATVTECTERCGPDRVDANESLFLQGAGTAGSRVVETARGRQVRLPLSLGDAESGTLAVGGPGGSYGPAFVVRDGDGDGQVTLVFDTANASNASRAVSAVGRDGVTVRGGAATGDDDPLDAGEYPLALYRGADADPLVGLLVVRESTDATGVTRFGFGRTPMTVRVGESVRVPVDLDESRVATLSVEGAGYDLAAVVREGTGDEQVTLRFRANATGGEPTLAAVAPGDEVTVTRERGSVSPGDYRLALYRGANATHGNATPPALWSAEGRLIVAEAPESPEVGPANRDTPVDGLSLPALGALGLGGLLAVAGLALLTGAVGR